MNVGTRARPPATAVVLVLTGLALALLDWVVRPNAEVLALTREGALIENTTAALYLIAAVLVLAWRDRRIALASWIALSLAMVAFAARELDLHKAWTTVSMLKARFWIGGGTPWAQKLAATAVLAPLVWAGVTLLRRHARPVLQGWRRAEPVALTAITFVVTLVLVKLLDRALDTAQSNFGLVAPTWLVALEAVIEETTELLLPLLVLLGLAQQRARPGPTPAGAARRPTWRVAGAAAPLPAGAALQLPGTPSRRGDR